MVNLEAARRQALGSHFVEAPDEAKKVSALKSGRLTMPPHKTWRLPEDPTWQEDPFQDNNWQFQYHMLRWLDPLRRAGASGDEEAARLWTKWARSWIEANPPGTGRSRWSWIDMSDGIRAMELCHGLTVAGEQDWLIASLHDHVAWLSEPSHLKRGNHGFHQHVGLFVLGVVLEEQAVTELAVERLTAQLEAAYDEQGANEEGAIGYHLQNYVWWNDALKRLDMEGIAHPEAARRLDLAPRLLAHATSPLNKFARIGDTDGSNPRKVDNPFTRFVVTEGKEGSKPESTTAIYDAGYAFLRSGWGETRPYREETFITATWGRQDKVHGHRDGGSVTYASNGVQWIDDTGKYYYGKSPMRTYVLSREGHNAVVIPGRTYRKNTDVVLLDRQETGDYIDLTFNDPGYNGVTITRRLCYLRPIDQLLVQDRLQTSADVSASQNWHAGLDVEVRPSTSTARLGHEHKASFITDMSGRSELFLVRGSTDPCLGWMSTGWRKKRETTVAGLRQTGHLLQWDTLIGPWHQPARDILPALMAARGDVGPQEMTDATVPGAPWSLVSSSEDTRLRLAPYGSCSMKVSFEGTGDLLTFELLRGSEVLIALNPSKNRIRYFWVPEPGTYSVRLTITGGDGGSRVMVFPPFECRPDIAAFSEPAEHSGEPAAEV